MVSPNFIDDGINVLNKHHIANDANNTGYDHRPADEGNDGASKESDEYAYYKHDESKDEDVFPGGNVGGV